MQKMYPQWDNYHQKFIGIYIQAKSALFINMIHNITLKPLIARIYTILAYSVVINLSECHIYEYAAILKNLPKKFLVAEKIFSLPRYQNRRTWSR